MSQKRILVLSDLHCGSIYGLIHPKFTTADGNRVSLNTGQQALWARWTELADLLASTKIDAVVLNGDVIDGHQRAQRGTELSLPMLQDQAACAVEVIQEFLRRARIRRAKIYGVQGTEYHDGKAAEQAEFVYYMLGCEVYPGRGTGRWSHEVLDLDVDGININFAHGISVSSGIYRSTAIDREVLFASLAAKEGRGSVDVVVRSHAHYFVHVEFANRHAIITPCWQLQTRYMRKRSVYRMIPDIGAIVLCVDGGRRQIAIQKYLCKIDVQRKSIFGL